MRLCYPPGGDIGKKEGTHLAASRVKSDLVKSDEKGSLSQMCAIRFFLSGFLALALLLASPLRAQYHAHPSALGEVAMPGAHSNSHHGHSHDDDDPLDTTQKPHNPADHSHETAVAAAGLSALAAPIMRSVLVVDHAIAPDATGFRLERPPRLS